MDNIVVSIKTFLRDEYLFRCVKSIKEYYPQVKIAICDDGNSNQEKFLFYEKLKEDGHYVFNLPFDSGMAKGRNFIIENTNEEYILYVDDDYIFTKEAGIENLYQILNNIQELSLVAGRIRVGNDIKDYQGYIKQKGKKLYQIPLQMNDWKKINELRYQICDLAFNYYLIRRNVFNSIKYDDAVKIGTAHLDFFLMLKKFGFKIAFTPDAIIQHEQCLSGQKNNQYEIFRKRKDGYRYLAKKWNVNKLIYFDKSIFDFNTLKKHNRLVVIKIIAKKILSKLRLLQ